MKITLVHNRQAGGDDQAEPASVLRDAGHEVVTVSTEDRWREAVREPTDLVAISGGDGTVGRVFSALIGHKTPIAILPSGTANNVATAMGLTTVGPRDLMARWPTAPRRRFDVLIASGPFDDIVAVEGIGLGVFATMMAQLDGRDNLALAHAAETDDKLRLAVTYLHDRLAEAPAHHITASLDGRDISGAYVLLEVCNISMVGPNLRVAPRAQPTDGCFDVVLVTEADRKQFDRFLSKRLKGRRSLPMLPTSRGRQLSIEWTGYDLHLDDRTWPGTDVSFSTDRATIDIRVAPGAVMYVDAGIRYSRHT